MNQLTTQESIGASESSLFGLMATTLFLSSALMFSVEPLIAKVLLPIFGGTPMIWNSCVVFFQAVLLLGYAYAWGLSQWFSVRQQVLIQMLVLALPLTAMPPTVSTRWAAPSGNPVSSVVLTVAAAVGLPFFALSTSASVLQNWFAARARGPVRRDPYFLYATSNLGSFLALIAYPVVLEPFLNLREQRRAWAVGYLMFLAASLLSAVLVWQRGSALRPSSTVDERNRTTSVNWRHRLRWIVLSAVPSSLMLSVTTYLSTDLAPMPLLWVVPLALYLLTFAVAFSTGGEHFRVPTSRMLPLLAIPIVLLSATQLSMPLPFLIPFHLAGLLVAALSCHCELAGRRPNTSHLTEFYFWVACGGVLGGLFNTLIAPIIFTDVIEYPIGLAAACALRPPVGPRTELTKGTRLDRATPVILGMLSGVMYFVANRPDDPGIWLLPAFAAPALLAFRNSSRHPQRFALNLAVILIVGLGSEYFLGRNVYTNRTFFGIYRVRTDADSTHLILLNGTTLHGMQATSGSDRNAPLTYFHRTGPFGRAFASLAAISHVREVGVIGLGVGSLASYSAAGQRWTFYEIDPAVETIARNSKLFTYLRECGDRCRVVIGDARQSLLQATPGQYGLIVLDAFSSDAIPTHLLTKEALELYLSRLDKRGVLAFHISNRHLSLGPVLARLCDDLQLVAVQQFERVQRQEEIKTGKVSSDWIFIARSRDDLGPLIEDPRWSKPSLSESTPLWTDDYSNILSVIRFRHD
jgi:hypothetical protein